jgi:hypothetical protein
VFGTCGILASAKAVVLDVTAVGATAIGNLLLFPGDLSSVATTTVSFGAGQTRASAVVVGVADDYTGNVAVRYNATGGNTTHFILDLPGCFE